MVEVEGDEEKETEGLEQASDGHLVQRASRPSMRRFQNEIKRLAARGRGGQAGKGHYPDSWTAYPQFNFQGSGSTAAAGRTDIMLPGGFHCPGNLFSQRVTPLYVALRKT